MASCPKIKRKKKVDACPNPLFVQWLTEWKDEAAEKGIKTQYAYGKVSFLLLHVLRLHHLHGTFFNAIGDRIVSEPQRCAPFDHVQGFYHIIYV